jgi:hypothetical protein
MDDDSVIPILAPAALPLLHCCSFMEFLFCPLDVLNNRRCTLKRWVCSPIGRAVCSLCAGRAGCEAWTRQDENYCCLKSSDALVLLV